MPKIYVKYIENINIYISGWKEKKDSRFNHAVVILVTVMY